MYFAAHISVSLHLQALYIMKFNGLNFSEWSEQVQFHLGVLDLDLALTTDKPTAINDASKRSNRLNLMLMRMTIAENIRLMIPKIDSAKEFMKFVEYHSQFDFADKLVAGTLMGTLTTMKFDDFHIMHEHVTKMINIATRLGSMGLKVSDNFLVQFIINSLLPAYSPFQINYNTIKDKRNVTELQSMLIQEESRLKKQCIHSINLVDQSGAKKNQ
ncbi:hypothetical protein Pfo_018393 [Paulownia fortunei]|nr:hypothetical protein Pfo_018393 [Paulownia fortunei]